MKKKKLNLHKETPIWFTWWHDYIYTPRVDAEENRSKRSEKWIFIIITALIAGGVLSNGNTEQIAGFLQSFFG